VGERVVGERVGPKTKTNMILARKALGPGEQKDRINNGLNYVIGGDISGGLDLGVHGGENG